MKSMDSETSIKKHYRACNICDAMCGVEITYQDKKILSIKGDKKDPVSKGFICPKATALQDLHEDPDRLRQPMLKTENGWQTIEWERAFDIAAEKLTDIRFAFGKDSVAMYVGNPTAHNHGNVLFLKGLTDAINTNNRYSATSVDQLPHMLAAMKLFGNSTLFPIPDVERSRYLIIIGGNPVASGGSFMCGPDIKRKLSNIKRRKHGKVVCIDPRFTETAQIASEHYFITPGKDALLFLAMINVIFSEGLENTGHIPTENINVLKGISLPFLPEKVAEEVGIEAETIEQLAKDLATRENAALYARLGTCIQEYGSLCSWLAYVLNIITNNLDVEGGMMFPKPAIDLVGLGALSGEVNSFDRRRSRVRNMPSMAGEFPASTLADEMLEEGEGQIKALVTCAGNPVLSVPNGKKMEEGLQKLEFMLSFDMYINETTQHADLIIPPTSVLEHSHYDLVLQIVAFRHSAKYSPALFEKPEGSYHEWQSYLEVTSRINKRIQLGRGQQLKIELNRRYLNQLGDEGILNFMLKTGPYGRKPVVVDSLNRMLSSKKLPVVNSIWKGFASLFEKGLRSNSTINSYLETTPYGKHAFPIFGGLNLKKVKQQIHGIDIGPMVPMMPERLNTKSKSVDLNPEYLSKEINRLSAQLEQGTKSQSLDLLLIGRRHIRSNNSWLHNSHRLVKGKSRCTLMMHSKDATSRKLTDGEVVNVRSRVGEVSLPLEISDDIKLGVVSIPHGWGHHREGNQLSVASKHAGVSVNDLTDDAMFEPLTGQAICNGVPVQVIAG
jgi:anaerobic selenocysteine-containing dehydrogenase